MGAEWFDGYIVKDITIMGDIRTIDEKETIT